MGCGDSDGMLFSGADGSVAASSSSSSGNGGAPTASSSTASSSSSSGGGSARCGSSAASSSSGGGFYWKSGVQLNVSEADMSGWAECYSGLYADTNVPMQQILNGCPGSKLALGCRTKGGPEFQVLAMGDRTDATFMFP